MNLTTIGSEPQPSLAWTFESSNVDYVTNLSPSSQVSPGPAQLQGSAALTNTAPTSNTAVYFPETGSPYMDLGANSPAAVNAKTSNIFVECWIYQVNSTPYSQGLIGTSQFGQVWVFGLSGGRPGLYVQGHGGGNFTSSVSLNTWTHVAFSWALGPTSNTAYFYINGSASGSATSTAPVTGNLGNAVIGNVNGSMFNGYIRDLRVVQGGVVPTTSFTPGAAPFSYSLPSYVTGSGSTVFTLLGQFITYNPSGKFGKSVVIQNDVSQVNGNNSISWNAAFNIDSGITVAFWVKVQQIGTNTQTLLQYGGTAGASTIIFNMNNNGTVAMWFRDATYHTITSSALSVNTWNHLCISVGSGNVAAYLNGVSQGTTTYTPSGSTVTNFKLGAYGDSRFTPSTGEYDDLRIYNTALTAAQVQSIYTQGGAPASNFRAVPQPKLAWDFNGTTNPYIGSATGTVTGTVNYGTGKYGQSIIIKNDVTVNSTSNLVTWNPSFSVNPWAGQTICSWVKFIDLPNATNGSALFVFGDQAYGGLRIFVFPTSLYGNFYDSATTQFRTTSSYTYTISTGVWYHYSMTSFNGVTTIYFNGVPVGSGTFTTNSTMSSTTIIGTVSGLRPTSAEYDDLRLYDTALSAAQVQSIYRAQGMPSRGVVQATPTYNAPLTGASNLNRIYGLQRLNTAYTGNIINIRRSSDNTNVDFTVDSTNTTLITSSTGQTLSSWLGVGNANVVIWYDQSGNGRNLTQFTNGNQPGFSTTTGLLYRTGLYMNFPDAMAITDASFMVGYIQRGYYGPGSASQWYQQDMIVGGERGSATNDYGLVIGGSGLFGFGTGNTDGPASTIATNGSGVYSFMTCTRNNTTGQVLLYNGTGSGTSFTKNTGSLIGPNPTSMGKLTYASVYGFLNADVSSFFMFSSVKSPSEISSIASKFVNSTFQVTPVTSSGTPLFSQLSASTTSSVVGAFSLRAVNGTSTRAVAVQAHPVVRWSPTSLSGFSTTLSGQVYGNGTYTVSSSETENSGGRASWNLFNIGTSTDLNGGYHSPTTSGLRVFGSNSPNDYIGSATTTINGVPVSGLWVQIQLPSPVVLKSYQMMTRVSYSADRNRFPDKFYIVGSNNGTTWVQLDYKTYTNTDYDTLMTPIVVVGETRSQLTISIENSVSYTYYRLVVQSLISGDILNFSNFWLYGDAPSYAPNPAQDFYADRLGNLLTAPVTGQTLANWLGGATGYVTTWYNQIQPGQDVSATVAANQPIIDPVNKRITFNGTTQSFSNTSTSGGLLAACVGTGTKYTYVASWNKASPSATGRICEHNSLSFTNNQASALIAFNSTYGFNGESNDNHTLVPLTLGTQVSTIMRLNNTAAPNLRVRSNGTNYSGSTGNYTTLSLNNHWFVIGRKASNNSEFFNGTIKNVMVFKDELSDSDAALLDAWQQTL